MGDIVERLKARRDFMTAVSPYHLMDEAADEITRLRAEVERLQGDENGMSTATVGSFAVGHLREMYRKAYDALGSSGRVSLRNHINSMVLRREAEALERAAQIAEEHAAEIAPKITRKRSDFDIGLFESAMSEALSIAAAIRQAASGET